VPCASMLQGQYQYSDVSMLFNFIDVDTIKKKKIFPLYLVHAQAKVSPPEMPQPPLPGCLYCVSVSQSLSRLSPTLPIPLAAATAGPAGGGAARIGCGSWGKGAGAERRPVGRRRGAGRPPAGAHAGWSDRAPGLCRPARRAATRRQGGRWAQLASSAGRRVPRPAGGQLGRQGQPAFGVSGDQQLCR